VTVTLSLREQTCLSWAAQGKSSWDIGEILAISENTVNFHIKNAMRKLETTSRTVAAIKAVQLGIIHAPARPEPGESPSSGHSAPAAGEREHAASRDCGEAATPSLLRPGLSSGFDRIRIRVVPFLAPQSRRHEAVAFSLSQEIAVGLARFSWFDVTAPVSLKCRSSAHLDGQAAAHRGIDYVIDGALSSNDHEVQIRVRLLDLADDARQVWSFRFNLAIDGHHPANEPPPRVAEKPDLALGEKNEQERRHYAPELLHAAVRSILSRHRPRGMARQIAS
jgi:DNA-binding CsgD family transcriptional regulator/TolB-like protein